MKRIVVLVIFGVILLLGVFAVFTALFQPVDVDVATVQLGEAIETVYATGHVEARNRRTLRAQRPAVIAEVYASPRTGKTFVEGDSVLAGEPILRLRESTLTARRDAAQAELTRVSAQLSLESPFRQSIELRIVEAEKQSADERQREQRLKAQLDSGGISRDAYDLVKTRADVSEQQLAQLRREYEQTLQDLQAGKTRAQSELDTVNATERDDTVLAPLDGVLLTLPLKAGEFAFTGAEVAKVGDLREMIVEAEVNEDDIARVTVGGAVMIRLAGFEDVLVNGSVFELLPDADRGTKGYTVKMSFSSARWVPQENDKLKGWTEVDQGARPLSGMTAELGVVVRRQANALTFPRPALTAEGTVFVIGDNDRAREVRVALGLVNFSTCQALGGLAQGDRVAISNLNNLSDGARVSTREAPSTSSR